MLAVSSKRRRLHNGGEQSSAASSDVKPDNLVDAARKECLQCAREAPSVEQPICHFYHDVYRLGKQPVIFSPLGGDVLASNSPVVQAMSSTSAHDQIVASFMHRHAVHGILPTESPRHARLVAEAVVCEVQEAAAGSGHGNRHVGMWLSLPQSTSCSIVHNKAVCDAAAWAFMLHGSQDQSTWKCNARHVATVVAASPEQNAEAEQAFLSAACESSTASFSSCDDAQEGCAAHATVLWFSVGRLHARRSAIAYSSTRQMAFDLLQLLEEAIRSSDLSSRDVVDCNLNHKKPLLFSVLRVPCGGPILPNPWAVMVERAHATWRSVVDGNSEDGTATRLLFRLFRTPFYLRMDIGGGRSAVRRGFDSHPMMGVMLCTSDVLSTYEYHLKRARLRGSDDKPLPGSTIGHLAPEVAEQLYVAYDSFEEVDISHLCGVALPLPGQSSVGPLADKKVLRKTSRLETVNKCVLNRHFVVSFAHMKAFDGRGFASANRSLNVFIDLACAPAVASSVDHDAAHSPPADKESERRPPRSTSLLLDDDGLRAEDAFWMVAQEQASANTVMRGAFARLFVAMASKYGRAGGLAEAVERTAETLFLSSRGLTPFSASRMPCRQHDHTLPFSSLEAVSEALCLHALPLPGSSVDGWISSGVDAQCVVDRVVAHLRVAPAAPATSKETETALRHLPGDEACLRCMEHYIHRLGTALAFGLASSLARCACDSAGVFLFVHGPSKDIRGVQLEIPTGSWVLPAHGIFEAVQGARQQRSACVILFCREAPSSPGERSERSACAARAQVRVCAF